MIIKDRPTSKSSQYLSVITLNCMQPNKKRPFNKIEYSNQARKSNVNAKKGTQQQTTSLNINLKTLTKASLLQFINEENKIEKQIVKQYINDKANFSATRRLFGAESEDPEKIKAHSRIKEHMLKEYEQTSFVKKVLSNQKMDINNKLIFIKFLEKIRNSAIAPVSHTVWKERF